MDVRPLRDSPPFRRLWFGEAVSYVGNIAPFLAVPFQLYRLTNSTLQAGLLSLADAVPLLALAMVGGTIADAVDRRRLALVTGVGLALVSGLLAVNATLRHAAAAAAA